MPEYGSVWEVPIEELDPSVRLYNILRRMNVETLGDLDNLDVRTMNEYVANDDNLRVTRKWLEELREHLIYLEGFK